MRISWNISRRRVVSGVPPELIKLLRFAVGCKDFSAVAAFFAAMFTFVPACLRAEPYDADYDKFLKKYPNAVYVSDFGAIADDGRDDTGAVAAAIKAAVEIPGTRIVFNEGRYDFKKLKMGIAAIGLSGVSDLAIDGRGAIFVGHSEGAYIGMSECENVCVRGIKIRDSKMPYAVGRVGKIDKESGSFECALFAPFAASWRYVKAVTSYDMGRKIFTSETDAYQTRFRKFAKPVDPWVLSVPLENPAKMPEAGEVVVLRYQVYAPPAIIIADSRNVRFERISIESHAGAGIFGCNSENILLDKINVIPEGDGILSTTADGINLDNCRGKIRVSDCEFYGTGDDAVGIRQTYWVFCERTGENSARIKLGRRLTGLIKEFAPRKGDVLRIGGKTNWLRPEFESVVVESKIGEKPGEVYITCENPLPEYAKAGMPVSNATAFPRVDIVDCKFGSNRGRGLFLLTEGAEVKGCSFTDTALPAIYMRCDFSKWMEGPAPRDIKIEGCSFKNCNHWRLEDGAPAIYASAKFPESAAAEGWVGENISVEGCTFEDCSEVPVRLENIKNIGESSEK